MKVEKGKGGSREKRREGSKGRISQKISGATGSLTVFLHALGVLHGKDAFCISLGKVKQFLCDRNVVFWEQKDGPSHFILKIYSS